MDVREQIAEVNPEALCLDGLDGNLSVFDDAIIGVASRCAMAPVVVYDEEKIIGILVLQYDMSEEEAWEWYDYNMAGAYVGEGTPLFLKRFD